MMAGFQDLLLGAPGDSLKPRQTALGMGQRKPKLTEIEFLPPSRMGAPNGN